MDASFKKLGSGTFGDVYLHQLTNKVYKFAKLIKSSQILIDNTLREATFYKLLYNAKRNSLHHIRHDATLCRFTSPPASIPQAMVTTQSDLE